MKRLIFLLSVLLLSDVAFAKTINWYVGGSIYTTTTCSSGDSVTPPTPPTQYGYTFIRWRTSYTPIEYLESSGTQYIDTGYQPNNNTRVVVKYAPNTSTWGVFGGRVGSSGTAFTVMYQSSGKTLRYNYNKGSLTSTLTLTTETFTLDADRGVLTVYNSNGENIYHGIAGSAENDFSVPYNIFFPGINTSGKVSNATGGMTIYYFRIYDNTTLVRDFIPALDNNGTPCMYDKITKTFFYNAGTGDFIAGPVIDDGNGTI